jgi:hypothetical protein
MDVDSEGDAKGAGSQPMADNLMESVKWLGQARREHKQLLVRGRVGRVPVLVLDN